jgi:hypothetical protein
MDNCRPRSILTILLILGAAGCGGDPSSRAGAVDPTSESAIDASAGARAGSASSATPLLTDATDEWGVSFTYSTGASGDLLFPEMMGGGIAIFDADSDADLDLYLISGAPDLGRNPGAIVNRLFLQGDDGRFADATDGSGLGDPGYGTGVAVGDFDNDGNEDVFVANVGPDRLYRGRGDGTFLDVTSAAGIEAAASLYEDWSSSAAFCDVDRDGFLDLYIVRYVVWDPDVECTDSAGRREYCGPDSFPDATDVLLHNQGDGTFRDISEEAGIFAASGAGLGVLCLDMDEDGWMDIYVANDGDPNQLWINQRDGTFLDDALIMGASVNAAGLDEAGMGVVAADFDNDTDLDLFLTHLRDETNTFYRNLGAGIGFEDQTARIGLARESTPYTGFGTAPVDIDLDADLDLLIANGRVLRGDELASDLPAPWSLYGEPNLVYSNEGDRFTLLKDEVADFIEPVEVSRGLAVGDLDGDGDLDVIVSNIESPVRLLRAEVQAGHWLLVDAFDPRLGRRALGAKVTVRSETKTQVRCVQGAMSYLSTSDPRAHFGLGPEAAPVRVEVRWPDGLEEAWDGVPVDQEIVLRRGEGSS